VQRTLLLGLALAACGNTSKTIDARELATDTMTLTSTAFVESGTIPVDNTCHGINASPPLAWTGAPPETRSFAVVLVDLAAIPPLVHWVIYDLPATATGLPAQVAGSYAPANVTGAHQTRGYDNSHYGYLGPCPAVQDRYVFAVHALDVAALPGADPQTTADAAAALIDQHHIARGRLSGLYGP
jgi:Raf kinase inhibitor-like YbhB/YbcL family protein